MFQIKSLEKIMPLLDEDLIAHLNTIGRMTNSKEVEVYVDNPENPKGLIVKDGYWHIPYSSDKSILVDMIKDFPWDLEVGFCGIPANIAELVKEGTPGYQLDWDEPCDLFYYPKKSLQPQWKVETLPALQPEHVAVVNQYYTYQSEDSHEYLMDCIQRRPSSVILDEENNPISWALIREDNSMGVMYTLESHRGKGLAEKVTLDLMKKVLDSGNTPYVHIVQDNTKSKGLAKKADFVHWGPVTWFGMKRKEG